MHHRQKILVQASMLFNILGELKADVEKACPSTLEIVDP